MRYKKKPIIVDAKQWTGDNLEEINQFFGGNFKVGKARFLMIQTLEGLMMAAPRDWIIRGIAGEVYPCKPDIFEATYEEVDDTQK